MNAQLRRELAVFLGLTASVLAYRNLRRTADSQPRQIGPLAGTLGFASLALALLPIGTTSFRGKVAVITGGSRGLGLALARELLHQGAKVTILARDPDELDRAKEELCQISDDVFDHVCDVCDIDHMENVLAETRAKFGKIDILINNAGVMSVGPFDSLDSDDFDRSIDVHLKAVIHATRLVLPYFRQNGGGRIINISSIGGIIPVPHLSAYSAGKFGLSGFSEAVAAELREEGILVTTVYPGLMRTGSPQQATFKGDAEKEFAWFNISDNTPGLSISPARAAKKILRASRDGRNRIVISLPAKLSSLAHSLTPELFAQINSFVSRLLPHGRSQERQTGAEARGLFSSLTWLKPIQWISRQAQIQNNQVPKFDAEANLGIERQRLDPFPSFP